MAIPTKHEDDWSDSDEEDERSDVETSVLLGIPDGEIESQEDLDDAAVSRVGGHPAFLTSTEPSITSSQCKHCSFPMELLVQLWCPFENSPMDRALYAFGCCRAECQRKPGSVRAFRGLRYNASYAAKLEKKNAREKEKETARLKAKEEEEKRKASAKINPFSMNASTAPSGGLFGAPSAFGGGLGTQLFGGTESDTHKVDPGPEADDDDEAPPPPESESEPGDSDVESSSSVKSILAAPARTPSSSSPWLAAPAYKPPRYLSTAQEYVPPAPKPPKLSAALQDGEDDADEKGYGKSKKAELRRAEKEKEDEKDRKAWENAMEGYEDSLEVDKVFEKFARVAGYEGEQCIRYELGGTPLPYANDAIFKSLFPSPSSSSSATPSAPSTIPISSSTKFTPSAPPPARRTYDPKSSIITPCPRCGGARTFECQLMPHLISVLQSQRQGKPSSEKESTERVDPEARKKELELPIRRGGQTKEGSANGMEWGTCLVFSCSQDCRLDPEKKEALNEVWSEELVLVQWDE